MLPSGITHTGPERALEPRFQSHNRDDVRPPRTDEDISERLSIDSGNRRSATHAKTTPGKNAAERSRHMLDNTRGVVLDDGVRPVLGITGQLSRSNAARTATGHRDANLSFMIDDQRDGRLICHFGWSTYTEKHVAQRIRSYESDLATAEERGILGDAVLALVAAAGPKDAGDARYLSMLAWMLAIFAFRRGLGVHPAVWTRHEVLDALVLTRDDLTGKTLLTYRSGLRRLRAGLTWLTEGEATPTRMRASQPPHEPYTDRHLAALRDWIQALRSAYQRRCARALLCLGAGCGMTSGEISTTRGSDLTVLDSGTVIVRPPASGRVLACRRAFEEDLAYLARFRDAWLFAPERTTENPVRVISNVVARMPCTRGVPRLDARRARSTWIVSLLCDRVPSDVVAKAAGLASSETLARYTHWVPPLTDEETLRLLRGTL